jgi:hypothetical protein
VAVSSASSCEQAPEPAKSDRSTTQDAKQALVRDLVIPRATPDYAFSSLAGIAEHPGDGRLAVVERQERQVLIFDSTGNLLASVGREGSGPGEFRSPTDPHWMADTLWIPDPSLGRITPIADGGSGETVSAPAGGRHLRMIPGGGIADVPWGPTYHAGMPDTQPFALAVRQRGLDRADTVFRTVLHMRHLEIPSSSGWNIGGQPFDDGELFQICEDGSGVVIVDRRTDRTSYTVTRISMDGDTVFDRQFEYDPLPLTDEQVEAAITRRGATAPGGELAVRKALFLPPHRTPVRQVLTGSDGTTWLELETADPDSSTWQVLDGEGDPAFRIWLPVQVWLSAATLDHIWTTEPDENGVPSLVRYRIAAD